MEREEKINDRHFENIPISASNALANANLVPNKPIMVHIINK